MSVLIKGMEMPKNCKECDVCYVDGSGQGYCILKDEYSDCESTGLERRFDCPLIEVPEHGDLIDKQKLCKDMFYTKDGKRVPTHDCDNFPVRFDVSDIQKIIRKQPVIILAEENK